MNRIQELLKKGYVIKALITRKNLPDLVDYAKRINPHKYHLKYLNVNIPSPSSNSQVHVFNGETTIWLFSPRVGTFIYMEPPIIELKAESNDLLINYNTTKKIEVPRKKTDDKGKETTVMEEVNAVEMNDTSAIPAGSIQTISTSMKLFNHDDRQFMIDDIETTYNKYKQPEESWLKKNMGFVLSIIFMIGVVIALILTYQQIVFPAAQYAIRPSTNVVCNITIPAGSGV